jgi:hypothetical protein
MMNVISFSTSSLSILWCQYVCQYMSISILNCCWTIFRLNFQILVLILCMIWKELLHILFKAHCQWLDLRQFSAIALLGTQPLMHSRPSPTTCCYRINTFTMMYPVLAVTREPSLDGLSSLVARLSLWTRISSHKPGQLRRCGLRITRMVAAEISILNMSHVFLLQILFFLYHVPKKYLIFVRSHYYNSLSEFHEHHSIMKVPLLVKPGAFLTLLGLSISYFTG